MRNIALPTLAALSIASCAPLDSDPRLTSTSCEIALRYTQSFRSEAGRPIAVKTDPGPLSPSLDEIEEFVRENPEFNEDSELPITREAAEMREIAVVEECPVLKSWLVRERILHDDARIDELTRKSEWPVAILAMSAPGLSPDGQTALMYVNETWGPLAGQKLAVKYRKGRDGQWRVSSKDILAIS